MGAVVWYADWQMECCGEPFELGDRVTWTVEEADDREWLPAALGPDHAATVTHLEEHHAQDESRLLTLTGFVTKITGAWCAYGPRHVGDDASYPTPGTERFVDLYGSHDLEGQPAAGQSFNGWLVELDTDD